MLRPRWKAFLNILLPIPMSAALDIYWRFTL